MNDAITTEQQHPANRKRWIWYTLLLMIPLVLLALVMSFVMNYRTIQHLETLGGYVGDNADSYRSSRGSNVGTSSGLILGLLSDDWQYWLIEKLGEETYSGLGNITYVDLRRIEIKDEFQGLSGFGGDVVIKTVIPNPKVTDAELANLSGLSKLKKLYLDNSCITDAGAHYLSRLGCLEELSLDKTDLSDAGLKHLKGLTNLQRLQLNETNLTDAGVVYLKGLRNLKYLELQGTVVTDAGLSQLSGLTNLKRLTLGTQVTPEGVKKLQASLPHCNITFDSWLRETLQKDWSPSVQKIRHADFSKPPYWDFDFPVEHKYPDYFQYDFARIKKLIWLEELSFENVYARDADYARNVDLTFLRDMSRLKKLNLNNTFVTDAGLKHLEKLTTLEELTLGDYITENGMQQIQAALPNCHIIWESWLKKNIGDDWSPNPEEIRTVNLQGRSTRTFHLAHLHNLKNLESLNLAGTIIRYEDLSQIKHLKKLKYLNLSDIEDDDEAHNLKEDEEGGMRHLKELTHLETLILNNTSITGDDLFHLSHLKNLRHLDLGKSENITTEGIVYLQGLTNLEYLDLSGLDYYEDEPVDIHHFPHLKTLILSETNITDAGLACLKNFTKLQHLDLSYTEVTDAGFVHLQKLTNLTHLDLSETEITSEILPQLSRLKKLKYLDLSDMVFSEMEQEDDMMSYLKELVNLETLILNEVYLSDTELSYFNTLKKLKHLELDVDLYDDLYDDGLKHFKGLKNLEYFDFGGSQYITAKGLVHLQGMTKLKYLNLTEMQECEQIFPRLKQFPHLETLILDDAKITNDDCLALSKELPRLKQLSLQQTEITDAGVVHLKVLTELTHLSLYGVNVTETGIMQLKGLPHLKVLFLIDTKIKSKGIEKIKVAFPDCKIITESQSRGYGHFYYDEEDYYDEFED